MTKQMNSVLNFALFFLGMIDWFTTSYLVDKYGKIYELNPLMRPIADSPYFDIVKISMHLIVFLFLKFIFIDNKQTTNKDQKEILTFLIFLVAVYVAIVVNNVWVVISSGK